MKSRCVAVLIWSASAIGLAQSSSLLIAPRALSFTAAENGNPPPPQIITVSTSGTTTVEFAVTVDSGTPGSTAPSWVSVPTRRATSPGRIFVSVDQSGISRGPQEPARILITSPNGQALADPIPVNLRVDAVPAQLVVSPAYVRMQTQTQRNNPPDQVLILENLGSGGVNSVTADVTAGGSWLRSSVDSCARVCYVRVSAATAGLASGAYSGSMRLNTPIGAREVPVQLSITDRGPRMEIAPAGLSFEARQGQGQTAARTVSIRNSGEGALNWSAEIFRGGSWLRLTTASGTVAAGAAGALDLTADASTVTPGTYSALVRITSMEAQNSPQYVTAALVVSPSAPGSLPPGFSTSGMLFRAITGDQPNQQNLRIYTSSADNITYQASPRVDQTTATAWLSATPARETTSAALPRDVFVAASPGNLPVGIYTGETAFTFGGLDLRTLNATFVVTLPTPDACRATRMAAVHTALPGNFSTQIGLPTPLAVRVMDDCGVIATSAQVTVTFSTGELPVVLTHTGDGNYSGVWTPMFAGPTTLVAGIFTAGMTPFFARLDGNVGASTAPVLFPGGILNSNNPRPGAPLAPGTVILLLGANLATSSGSTVPVGGRLPTTAAGATVLAGGIEAPIYEYSPARINAQLPAELSANREYQVVVSQGSLFTVPDTVRTVPVQPGLAVYPDGMVQARDSDYRLINSANPARRGDIVFLFLVGMGATSPSVPSGVYPPASEPYAQVTSKPEVLIDGRPSDYYFAGLTPCCIGAYQINALVGPETASGTVKVVVIQDGVASNEGSLLVQ